MAESTVRLVRDGAVVHIVLDRPSARNALSVAMCEAFLAAIKEAATWVAQGDVRVATLEAEGPVFCAGADLKERRTMEPAAMSAHSRLIASCADALAEMPCPTLACVNGAALGGGFELCLACDIRIASTNASFGFPEVGLGFFPGAGGPVRLVRLIGMSAATFLLMTGERIDAAEAARKQIVHVVTPAEHLATRSRELGEKLAGFPASGIRALRQLLSSLDRQAREEGMALARKLRDDLNHDAAVASALHAFGNT